MLEDSFRDFARSLSGPLSANDSNYFRSKLEPTLVTCNEEEARQLDPDMRCSNIGQEFEGISMSYWRSGRGGFAPIDSMTRLIERLWIDAVPGATDEFGESAARVHAISLPDPSWAPEAPQLYTVVLAAIHDQPMPGGQTGPGRVALVTQWEYLDGEWRLTRVMDAFRGGHEFVEPTQEARDNYLTMWERFTP